MKANKIVSKTNSRMNQIQEVSRCIRLFLLYGIPVIWIGFFISIFFIPKDWAATQINSSDSKAIIMQMNSMPGHLWTLSEAILFLFWYRIILKLFGFFERGILFTAETVRCIQVLGCVYIADFLTTLIFYFFIPHFLNDWGLGHLLAGLFIVFIGWLIDEARKIHEEQELTI